MTAPLAPHPWMTSSCDTGCCVVVIDPQLRPPDDRRSGGVHRPMFQVLLDDGTWGGDVPSDSPASMRVPAVEYARPDRLFL